jgi:choloylglycine hydrolase
MRNVNLILLAIMLAVATGSPGPVLRTSPLTEMLTEAQAGQTACTSFCLDQGDHCVFGANQDNDVDRGLVVVKPRGRLKTSWEPSTTGRYARWIAKYGSLTLDYAGLELAWAGLNEAGLMISTMALGATENPHPDERPPLISPLWVQYQLDNHATVEEVIASDDQVRITGNVDHFLVCDARGECAVIEFLNGQMVAHRGDALPVAVLANSTYPGSLDAWRERRPSTTEEGHSLNRFAEAADAVTAFQPTTAQAAVQHAFDTLAEVALPNNAWRIVFDPSQGRVHFWTHGQPVVRSVDLGRLDLACGAPLLMLDIHAPLEGDISDRFEPYDHRASLAHSQAFVLERGMQDEYPPYLVNMLIGGMESFRCAGGNRYEGQPVGVAFADYDPWLPPTVAWAARYAAGRFWPVWLGLTLLSLAVVLRRLPRDLPPLFGRRAAWLAGVAILGPLGLLVYLLTHR